MREEVIVYVKTEIRDEDEEQAETMHSTERAEKDGEAGEEGEHGASSPFLEDAAASSSLAGGWPCANCGRVFSARLEVLAHVQEEHAAELLDEYISRIDGGVRERIAHLKATEAAVAEQQRRLLLSASLRPLPPSLFPLPFPLPPSAFFPRFPTVFPSFAPSMRTTTTTTASSPFPFPSQAPSSSSQRTISDSSTTISRIIDSSLESSATDRPGLEVRRGRPRHPVWSLFIRIDKFDAECCLCRSRVRSACPTNLCRHLNNNHCEIASRLFADWKKQKELSGSYPPLAGSRRVARQSEGAAASGAPPPLATSTAPCQASASSSASSSASALAASLLQGVLPFLAASQQLLLLRKQEEEKREEREEEEERSRFAEIGDGEESTEQTALSQQQHGVIRFGTGPISNNDVANEASGSGAVQQGMTTSNELTSQLVQASRCATRLDLGARAKSESPRLVGGVSSRTVEREEKLARGERAAESERCREAEEGGWRGEIVSVPEGKKRRERRCRSEPFSFMLCTMDTATTPGVSAGEQPSVYHHEVADCRQQQQQQSVDHGHHHLLSSNPSGINGLVVTNTPFSLVDAHSWLPAYQDIQSSHGIHNGSTAALLSPSDMRRMDEELHHLRQKQPADAMATPHMGTAELAASQVKREADEAVAGQSGLPSDVPPPAKRGRPTENPCWNYFLRLDEQNVRCRLCLKIVKSACATNMTKHLERHHHDDYRELVQHIRSQRQAKPSTSAAVSSSPPPPVHSTSNCLSPTTASSSTSLHPSSIPNTVISSVVGRASADMLHTLSSMQQGMPLTAQLHLPQPQSGGGGLSLLADVQQPSSHCLLTTAATSTAQPTHYFKISSPVPDYPAFFQDAGSLSADDVILVAAADGSTSYATAAEVYGHQFGSGGMMREVDDSQWQSRGWPPISMSYEPSAWGAPPALLQTDPSSSGLMLDPSEGWHTAPSSSFAHASVIHGLSGSSAMPSHDSEVVATSSSTASVQLPSQSCEGQAPLSSAGSSSNSSSSSSSSASASLSLSVRHHNQQQQSSSGGSSAGLLAGEKPYMKRNRKTEHPVWEFFKRTPDGNAQCSICTGVVKSPCSSNFMRHLMRHHSAEYNTVYIKWLEKRTPK